MNTMMMQAMQQIQALQEKVAAAQKELETMTVTEEGGNGLVRATADGRGHITRLDLSPDLLNIDDHAMIEDLVMSTVNRVLASSRSMSDQHLARATEGLMPSIPGLNLPF